ncbi:MAG TPA: hypothetical protein VFA21_04270 [Pyrinomonadaceae bacterium]|nr:hypothetical protein [Pyrinomonadaceae bacterium]
MKNKTLLGATAVAALLLASACTANITTNTSNSSNASSANANKPANTNASTASTPANTNAASSNSAATNSNSGAGDSASNDKGAVQDFTLNNETGVEIHKVYISPHDSNDWEEDILGRDTLPSGQSVDIKFNRSEKAAEWDLRVEDSQGNAIEWENLNLLKISKLTLHYKDGKATADME